MTDSYQQYELVQTGHLIQRNDRRNFVKIINVLKEKPTHQALPHLFARRADSPVRAAKTGLACYRWHLVAEKIN